MLPSCTEKKDIYKLISRNIKKYRKQKKITQKQLAEMSGYSYAYIRRIEAPNCPNNYSILTLYNICNALKIDIRAIFEEDDI